MVLARATGPIVRGAGGDIKTLRGILLDGTLVTPQMAAWTAGVTGSGATSQTAGYFEINTGVTTGSTARLYTAELFLPGTSLPVDFSKRVLWGFTVRRFTGNADIIGRVQLKAATTEGALTARGLGIRMANLTMTGEGYESAGAFTGTIQTMVSATNYGILVDHEPAVPRTRFYVNGVLQATQSTSANVPQSSTGSVVMILSILNGAGTTDGYLETGTPWVYQAF